MTVVEILRDMINRQKRLDIAMYGSNNAEYNQKNTYRALFDELGELNHELKAEWCWLKKTQAPVNREKVLGELADVWHFALNIFYHEYEKHDVMFEFKDIEDEANFLAKTFGTFYFYKNLIDEYYDHYILGNLLALTFKLGFTLEELYEAYKTKNEINYQRIASGY